MKSQAQLLHLTVVGILKDVQLAYPEYRGVARDIERLSHLVKCRGLGLFTLDLPNLDSILLEGIERGRLILSGPVSRQVSKKVQVPRFLSGLWLRVFSPNSCLLEKPDPTAIAFLRQIFCFGKKIEVECTPDRLTEALDEYSRIERELRKPSLGWENDELFSSADQHGVHFCDILADHRSADLFDSTESRYSISDARLLRELQLTADAIVGDFAPFDASDYSVAQAVRALGFTGFRHGPGAVADAKGKRGTIDKYQFPSWPRKLQICFPYAYCGMGLSPYHDSSIRLTNREPPAKLHAVPKTAKAPRIIAAEPIAHQWCQQVVRDYLTREIRKVIGNEFITFSNQSMSHVLVERASRDRSLATVDLSSASDRLSCHTVERIFRVNPTLLSALHSARTRWIEIPRTSGSGVRKKSIHEFSEFTKLRKFASQGTAVTFPVQTLVFFICAISLIEGRNIEEKLANARDQVRIYGDDIVIPADRYASLCRLLELLQLKVNTSKSFVNSKFRESCGLDCFDGYDVTPLKPKRIDGRTPEGWMSMLDLCNNLYFKGYWQASKVIERTLYEVMPRSVRPNMLHIRGHSSGSAGLASYCGTKLHPAAKVRWNESLQREEVLSVAARAVTRGSRLSGDSGLRRFFFEGSSPNAPRSDRLSTVLRVSNYPKWESTAALV